MRRAAVMGCTPYIQDYWRKDTKTLFEETGGNTGNLAFQFAVASHLGGNPPIAHWGMDPKELKSKADIIVLPLANQLGKHTDLGTAADRLEAFGLPVIGVGLGAQAPSDEEDIVLSAGTERWLRTIARLAPSSEPNIGVRGPYTKKQIERYGLGEHCVVTGCPSNFINTTDRIAERIEAGFDKQPEFIAVNAGIPHLPKLKNLEISLARLATGHGESYIVQHGIEMLHLARNEFSIMRKETLDLCHQYIMPDASLQQFQDWCRIHAVAHFDARAWMDHLRRFDFVVGTRFHGAMLAFQAGVPAACIAHDSRTYEMCTTMQLPVCKATSLTQSITGSNIRQFFSFSAEAYNRSRASLLSTYLNIYKAADVPVSASLNQLSTRLLS